jgi:hypothetical protein
MQEKNNPHFKKSEGWKRKEMKKSVYALMIHYQYPQIKRTPAIKARVPLV